MAEDFLQYSRTYRETTRRDIFRRRHIVCGQLNKNYRFNHGSVREIFQGVREYLADEGIEIGFSTFQADKQIIQLAYRFLQASTGKERLALWRVLKDNHNARGVHCLLADGIFSWADIEKLRGSQQQPAMAAFFEGIGALQQEPEHKRAQHGSF